jgi:hypothetical protein
MIAGDIPTYQCHICEEPSTFACSHQHLLVCKLCGAPAERTEDGSIRHAGEPWEDGSGFCEKYGYPIPAKVPPMPARLDLDGTAKPLTEIAEALKKNDDRTRTLYGGAGESYVVRPTEEAEAWVSEAVRNQILPAPCSSWWQPRIRCTLLEDHADEHRYSPPNTPDGWALPEPEDDDPLPNEAQPGDPTVRHVVAWMRATYPMNAHAQEWADEIDHVFLGKPRPEPTRPDEPRTNEAQCTCGDSCDGPTCQTLWCRAWHAGYAAAQGLGPDELPRDEHADYTYEGMRRTIAHLRMENARLTTQRPEQRPYESREHRFDASQERVVQTYADTFNRLAQRPDEPRPGGGSRYTTGDRLQDIIDENFGMQPTMTDEELLTLLERKLFEQRVEYERMRKVVEAARELADQWLPGAGRQRDALREALAALDLSGTGEAAVVPGKGERQ